MLDDRGVVADSPQRSSYGQLREQLSLHVCEAKKALCFGHLIGGLPEEDAGLGVRQKGLYAAKLGRRVLIRVTG